MATNTTASLASQLEALAAQLNAAAKGLRDGSGLLDDFGRRREITDAAQAVVAALQQGMDEIMSNMIIFPAVAATRLFIEWKVFEHIPTTGSITYADLAAKVDADTSLITRLAATLVSTGVLTQEGEDRVAHTTRSAVYAGPGPLKAIVEMSFDTHLQAIAYMPKFFRDNGRKEPSTRLGTITACAQGEPGATVWELTMRDPARTQAFMQAMQVLEAGYPFSGTYSLSWVVDRVAADPARKLFVDVGGSAGHALKAVLRETPGLDPARCVLQDLPQVVERVRAAADEGLKGVELVALDFHTEQPVKGAFVYYIRRCLHDYGDDECVGILRVIRDAMADDSRLLVVEQILDNPPKPLQAAIDIYMATISGKERSEQGFRKIAEAAGLRLVKVWKAQGADAGVVELAKA